MKARIIIADPNVELGNLGEIVGIVTHVEIENLGDEAGVEETVRGLVKAHRAARIRRDGGGG